MRVLWKKLAQCSQYGYHVRGCEETKDDDVGGRGAERVTAVLIYHSAELHSEAVGAPFRGKIHTQISDTK